MASFPQKTNVATAITHRSNLPLSDRHVSTTNFMELGVAKIREMVPSESINLNMRSFARLDTMKKPTQGDCIVNSRAYFVPFRVIQSNWDDFKNNLPVLDSSGSVSYTNQVDSIAMIEFVRSFINDLDPISGTNEYIAEFDPRITISRADDFDFTIQEFDEQDGAIYQGYRFTAKGARIFKLLCQLGYAIDFNAFSNVQQLDNYVKSALPLKALLKIYFDHYFPSQYSASQEFYTIKYILEYPDNDFTTYCDFTVLRYIYDFIDKVCYDSDYFVSAWDNPTSPNVGAVQNNIVIPDITRPTSNIIEVDNVDSPLGTPSINTTGASRGLNAISTYALTALKSLTDFMKRHQIVGARVLDRYLAQWGIVLPSAKLNRSVYIDNFSQPIIFGDVTSTADTDGANLGSYAGKGILPEREFSFSYETDEFGYFMILSSVVPVTGYYQGEDRMVSHLTPFDFYTPEFDNLGVQAIGVNELYVPMNSMRMFADPTNPNPEGVRINSAVFGFTPRYAEYKIGKDKLTGDFRLGSRNTELDAWHLFRNMDNFFEGKNLDEVTHDINFVRGIDSEQYNRIFNYMGDLSDKIKIIHYFNYDVSFPGRKLFDSYEFTDEDKAKKVSVDVGGSKSN